MTDLATMTKVLEGHDSVAKAAAVAVRIGGRDATVGVVELTEYSSGPLIREYARDQLGADAVVDAVLVVDQLPATADEVRAVAEAEAGEVLFELPSGPLQTQLAGIWAKALDRPRVGATDDFLELGGDSLGALAVLADVEADYGVALDIYELMDAATVRGLAELLRERGVPDGEDPAAVLHDVWSNVLGRPRIEPDEDFFTIGGNSLYATHVSAALSERLGLSVPYGWVFGHRTLREQAAHLDELRDDE